LREGLKRLKVEGPGRYARIALDRFEEEGIRFYASAVEKEAWERLKALPEAEEEGRNDAEAKPAASLTPADTRRDEAIFALKAARKFIDEGCGSEEVVIVCSDLGRYRPHLTRYARQLGLSLRFSSGVSMAMSPLYGLYMRHAAFEGFARVVGKHIEATNPDEWTLKILKRHFGIFEGFDRELRRQAGRVAELFGEKPDMERLKKEGTSGRFIPPDPESSGLLVTEPNQMTKRRFARVIFIGGDLSAFPPKSGGDIFRSARQKVALLGHNNSYRLSAHYVECMRKNAGALHVAWPQNEGRRPLRLSPVLSDIEAPPLDVTDYRIERDALLDGRRARFSEETERYIAAMKSPEATPYDGAMRRHAFCRHTLSATALETYAKCPLRYLFARRYKLEAPAVEKDEERFEASDIGTIFHEVAQRFAEDVKKGVLTLKEEPDDASRRHIEAIADEVFENHMRKEVDDKGLRRTLFHELVLTDLKKGLYDEHHAPGLLIRLLRYFHAEGRLENLEATERYFRLDDDFAPTLDEGALVQGFIDRLDIEGERVRIVDYKTGGYKKEKEERLYEEMEALRAFQLPLYLLYAKAALKTDEMEAHLVSFCHDDGYKIYGRIGTDREAPMRYDAEYEAKLKARVRAIDGAMREGAYGMTPSERNCEYCDFIRICHASVLPHKEAKA